MTDDLKEAVERAHDTLEIVGHFLSGMTEVDPRADTLMLLNSVRASTRALSALKAAERPQPEETVERLTKERDIMVDLHRRLIDIAGHRADTADTFMEWLKLTREAGERLFALAGRQSILLDALADHVAARPRPVSLDAWIEREFRGHGVATRREEDLPHPDEPFMSMAVAKDLVRRAVAEFERPQPVPGDGEGVKALSRKEIEAAIEGNLVIEEVYDGQEVVATITGIKEAATEILSRVSTPGREEIADLLDLASHGAPDKPIGSHEALGIAPPDADAPTDQPVGDGGAE